MKRLLSVIVVCVLGPLAAQWAIHTVMRPHTKHVDKRNHTIKMHDRINMKQVDPAMFDEGMLQNRRISRDQVGRRTEIKIARCIAGNKLIFEGPVTEAAIDQFGNLQLKPIGKPVLITRAVCIVQ